MSVLRLRIPRTRAPLKHTRASFLFGKRQQKKRSLAGYEKKRFNILARAKHRNRPRGTRGPQMLLLGWQPQARCAELLRQADVLVLPSVNECGGAVVLEAMASAKAVIAVDWGGPSDYLDDSCGIRIEPQNPAKLVSGLEAAIISLANDRNHCARLGRAGREKVLSEYTWPMKIERLLEIYRLVMRRKASKN